MGNKRFFSNDGWPLSLCFLISILLGHSMGYAEIFPDHLYVNYLEVTGSKEVPFTWSRVILPDGTVKIVLIEGEKKFVNICSDSGETLGWEYQNGDRGLVKAWREGEYLHIAGTKDGAPVKTRKKLDSRPWYQPLSFSLRHFLQSDEEKVSFWTIRSNTLDVYVLEATKKSMEKIDTFAGSEQAQVVEIRVKGFLSRLWHATYWYRKQDGLFLRYQAAHGPVGTEKTTVDVVSETP